MNNAVTILEERLQKRAAEQRLRSLTLPAGIDLCSNDYLGLARSSALQAYTNDALRSDTQRYNGATGSRLLSGNSLQAEEAEQRIAAFHGAEAGLLFNSGYDANLGLLSCIAQRGDTIFYDELAHASIIDGVRLSHATAYKFRHNDLSDLEQKLSKARGNIFIAVESVYSMDGDMAPLQEIVALAERYHASVIADEAHATGVFGQEGRGLVCAHGLQDRVLARVHTFGKALGVHGALICGSATLRRYLINFARTFIYTTALPPHSVAAIQGAYNLMQQAHTERAKLFALITRFKTCAARFSNIYLLPGDSPIQTVIIPGNTAVKQVAAHLQSSGFDVRPILSPTVPQGKERLRICLHSFNTETELHTLLQFISEQLELI